ncbi:DUF397 domain-containing protein [Streptomyces sp. CA-250714]|uniref:DUF397 domain-containing protein n=1 Tax=Streptomyces sp. CA-250714 TaxID=3240060 RepID=UPI003D8B4591
MTNVQPTPGTEDLAWFKSSYSGDQGGACLEVATCTDAQIHVRDSKVPTGPTLTLSPAAWASFTAYAAARS